MRRGIAVAMVIFGLAMVITGIWNFFPPFNTILYPPHIVNACIFGLLAIVHIWLNWKPIIRYFRGLGWWWVLTGLGIVLIIWAGIIVPALYIAGVY